MRMSYTNNVEVVLVFPTERNALDDSTLRMKSESVPAEGGFP